MSISQAIQKKDFKLLETTVEKALETYKAVLPDESQAMVNTVYGDVPASMLFDDESKWQVITAEYVKISNAAKALPKGADIDIEIAKLISTSAILRHIVGGSRSSAGLL